MRSQKYYLYTAFALFPAFVSAGPAVAGSTDSENVPAAKEEEQIIESKSYLTFGTRLGEETVEGFSDLMYPLLNNEKNLLFFNPRFSLEDEGAHEVNVGLGFRRRLTDWLVAGTNVYFDSRESQHDNRFSQWGVGAEMLTKYIDFRANYYDADNSKKLIDQYSKTSTETSSSTSAKTTSTSKTTFTSSGKNTGMGSPYAEGNAIYYDIYGEAITDYVTTTSYQTTYRTTTTTKTTTQLFQQFEAGMDGWDVELGGKIPVNIGPEVRLFGGYYNYDNPVGEDIRGAKGRIEVKTGPYFTLDAEVFEDKELNGSNYFVGFRLLVPLSKDLTWHNFMQGLFSMRHRDLDERMRSEMVMRDVRVQAKESDWMENEAEKEVDVQQSVHQEVVSGTKTSSRREVTGTGTPQKVKAADNITFVDGDNTNSENGTNEHPYNSIQEGVDNAGNNKTIFVYETGGTSTGKPGSADGGGAYDEQVTLKEGQTLTSKISWDGGSYRTENSPIIKPTTVTKTVVNTGSSTHDETPVLTMVKDTTVQRMKIDATALASVASTDVVTAIAVDLQNVNGGKVVIEDTWIKASGDYKFTGISVLSEDASNVAVAIRDNTVNVTGELHHEVAGVTLFAKHTTDATFTLDWNVLNINEGQGEYGGKPSYGVYLDASESSGLNMTVVDSHINCSDYPPEVLHFDIDKARNPTITLNNNTFATATAYSIDAKISAKETEAASITFADNTFRIFGRQSTGLDLQIDGSINFTGDVFGNTFMGWGDDNVGIKYRDDMAGTLKSFDLEGKNTFSLTGSGAVNLVTY